MRAGFGCPPLGTSTRTSVAHSPPILCIPSSSFRPLRTKSKTTILRPIVILRTLGIPSKRLSVKSRCTLKYAQPLIEKRSLSEHSDEDSSSRSDGGEEYSSTHIGESSGDKQEELHLESEEIWEMISR